MSSEPIAVVPCTFHVEGNCFHKETVHSIGLFNVGHFHPAEFCPDNGCEFCADKQSCAPCNHRGCKRKLTAGCHLIERTKGGKPTGEFKVVYHSNAKAEFEKLLLKRKVEQRLVFPEGYAVEKTFPCKWYLDNCCTHDDDHSIMTKSGNITVSHRHPRQLCRKKKGCRYCNNIPTCPDPKCKITSPTSCHIYKWAGGIDSVVFCPQTKEDESNTIVQTSCGLIPDVEKYEPIINIYIDDVETSAIIDKMLERGVPWGDICYYAEYCR